MTSRTLRVGSVSYLNAKPLIHGLENDPNVDLQLAVPARLLDGLRSRQFDVALLPVIDYQRLRDARIVPSGGIGCDGPTLTVRIFSRTPIEKSPRWPATPRATRPPPWPGSYWPSGSASARGSSNCPNPP